MAEHEATEDMSDLQIKICEQIEYYFGDHNLPRDKFLKEQIKLDDGWVPLETMIKFNRLSRLTTNLEAIAEAVGKSKTGLLELSEDRSKLRRSPSKPLPEVTEEYKNALKKRSIYIKGFPTDATLDEIKPWLDSKAQVECIKMRATIQKSFKGSIFAVLNTDEAAKKFVETPGHKYKDTDLIVLTKEDYFAKKNEERKQHRADAKTKSKHDKEETQKRAEDDEMGIILFKEKALEALEKAKAAHDGNLQLRNKDVKWEVLEGEEEKEALKTIVENQQESFNRFRNKGRKFKGKGRGGGKGGQGGGKGVQGSPNKKVQFQGKKTKFDSDEENDKDAKGQISPKKMDTDEKPLSTDKAPQSPKKRTLEETSSFEEPASKQPKKENGAGDD